MNKFTILLFLSFLIFSCNSEKTENSTKTTTPDKLDCLYSIGNDLKLEWTAFKTTDKIAVKGTFDSISLINNSKENSIANTIINSKFEIKTNSINSGSIDRDGKLKGIFFKNFKLPETITGFIEECEGDHSKGKAIANVTMNNISHQVMMNYRVRENNLIMHGGFDLLNWEAQKSIDALHKACIDLHKGKDGISKTWSTMEIDLTVGIQKDCK